MFFSMIGFGQRTGEKYVVGIGNDQLKFQSVLEYLQKSKYVKVNKYCYTTQAIGVEVVNKEFKNYEEFVVYLKFEFDDLMLYKKDESIFTKECEREIK